MMDMMDQQDGLDYWGKKEFTCRLEGKSWETLVVVIRERGGEGVKEMGVELTNAGEEKAGSHLSHDLPYALFY